VTQSRAKTPNLTNLRASLRAAKLPLTDRAGQALATRLAELLDGYRVTGDDEVEAYRLLGPLYLRTLTSLGLTKAGRAVGDTHGSPGGVSADVAARDQLRARRDERERAHGGP
jgi:hypothetical protein